MSKLHDVLAKSTYFQITPQYDHCKPCSYYQEMKAQVNANHILPHVYEIRN